MDGDVQFRRHRKSGGATQMCRLRRTSSQEVFEVSSRMVIPLEPSVPDFIRKIVIAENRLIFCFIAQVLPTRMSSSALEQAQNRLRSLERTSERRGMTLNSP